MQPQQLGAVEAALVQKHLQEQKPQLAIPVLREIISLDPKNVNAQANLGVLVFFEGNYAGAIPHMLTRVATPSRRSSQNQRRIPLTPRAAQSSRRIWYPTKRL